MSKDQRDATRQDDRPADDLAGGGAPAVAPYAGAETDPHAEPLIDRAHLDSLARHIGRDAIYGLMAEGRAELADRLDRLARHAGAHEAEGAGADTDAALGALAHQIAGLAGNLGLRRVARHAVRASAAARAGQDAGGPLAALLEAGPASLAALDAWCAAAADDPT